jgi:hypothetical protein
MGCDIHAVVEVNVETSWDPSKYSFKIWQAHEILVGRNYEIFAALAGVRRENDDQPRIDDPRGLPEDGSSMFHAYSEAWGIDGHSHSYVTLAELKAFDTTQTYESDRIILSRDKETGEITSTCGGTNRPGPHERVGTTNVFGPWPDAAKVWTDLIAEVEHFKTDDMTDEDVRLVFFFDN